MDDILLVGGGTLTMYLMKFHTTGCVGLEAGVCGEVDNVHKHLIPPKLFKPFAHFTISYKRWLSVCFSQMFSCQGSHGGFGETLSREP